MQIIDLRSTLIDLFPVDSLDFMALMLDSFSTAIINKYGCAKLNVPPYCLMRNATRNSSYLASP